MNLTGNTDQSCNHDVGFAEVFEVVISALTDLKFLGGFADL